MITNFHDGPSQLSLVAETTAFDNGSWDPMCCYSRTDADIPLESWDSINNFLNILFTLYAQCAPTQNCWGRTDESSQPLKFSR